MFYEIKLKADLTRITGNDKDTSVKEHYILDAVTHGEAEAAGYKLYDASNAEVDVFAVFRSNIREIVNEKSEVEDFYIVTLLQKFTDENGKEKEQKYPILVAAISLQEAAEFAKEHLKQGYDSDMTIDAIRKTKMTGHLLIQ